MRTRRAARLAGVVLGGVSLVATATTAAHATAGQTGAPERSGQMIAADVINTLKNQGTGRCLDDSNSYGLRTYACNGSDYQKWRVRVWDDGTRRFQNVLTGRCLSYSGAGLKTYSCNTSKYQSWWIKRWNDGTIRLRNQWSGKCLQDSFFGGLSVATCSTSKYQSWY
ncbi:RICIN domain-containing protein [Streptomyces barkulensis]|uniref:RICIN domain-containing protein n=1 Tax=Streptomyces barkulensis TaxID=1257026 RepID=UPI000C6D1EE9|nr:RICIN domain-containing protein [Streptomyces barkulensis]